LDAERIKALVCSQEATGRMGCFDHVTISSAANRQGSHGILDGGIVAPDPRTSSIQMINVGFNNPAAVAVWSNG
jgi:hypothetical protein